MGNPCYRNYGAGRVTTIHNEAADKPAAFFLLCGQVIQATEALIYKECFLWLS